MRTTSSRVAALLVSLALVLAGFAGLYQWQGANLASPDHLCDAKGLLTMASDAERTGNAVAAGLYRQWAVKCQEAKEGKSTPEATPSTSASATPSASPSATPTPSTTPTTNVEEFLANRPVNTKTSTNAYGPRTAVLPKLKNKGMEDLTADEAKAELIYVSEAVDRMQTADKALDLGIVAKNGSKNQVNELTERFVKDRAYWDDIRKQVGNRLRELTPSIDTVPAGTIVGMSYSIPGAVPQIGSSDVKFGYATKWIVLKDVKGNVVAKYRLLCHFQHGDVGQDMPTPPPGTGITPEGEPTILVDACRKVNGKWEKVYNVEAKQGDLPLNSPKCTTTPAPSETPTPTPTETPTPTPTETPTPTSTPTPSTVAKDPSKDPASNGNAGNGGGQNQDPGPGEVTNPDPAPDTPRVDPAPPSSETSTSSGSPGAPGPEAGAPVPSAPAEGTACAPGVAQC